MVYPLYPNTPYLNQACSINTLPFQYRATDPRFPFFNIPRVSQYERCTVSYQFVSQYKAGGRAFLAFCRNTTVASAWCTSASDVSSAPSRASGCSLVAKLGAMSWVWDMACSGTRATSSSPSSPSFSPSVVANENLGTQQVQAGRTAGK